MDKTKEYILQCEKAVKVQELWKIERFDYYWTRYNLAPVNIVLYFNRLEGIIDGLTNKFSIDSVIWLPTQSQLQGMVKGVFSKKNGCRLDDLNNIFVCFYRFYQEDDIHYIVQFRSMEQLWLAFVMKERWNKTWDGKDWV